MSLLCSRPCVVNANERIMRSMFGHDHAVSQDVSVGAQFRHADLKFFRVFK